MLGFRSPMTNSENAYYGRHMSNKGIGFVRRIASTATTILGIILCLVPLALWVAWNEAILLVVVSVGAISAATLCVLADFVTPAEDRSAYHDTAARKVPIDDIVAEIHRIFPLTYHHSLIEKARFRQAMQKVRQLLR
jgi:hypothetical protein